jgi:hydrogenase large subunit
MAKTKIVVDPITRIEGHLRIEAQAEAGMISDAWASSTQFRGIELVMQGRDPRDAWAFKMRSTSRSPRTRTSSATWSTGCSSSRTT